MNNKLVIGTAQFGVNYGIANSLGQVKSKEAKKILDYSLSEDINYIDTATSYGESERVLGSNDVNRFKIITKIPKIPYDQTNVYDWLESSVLDSLNRLNVKSIHALLLHSPEDLLGVHGLTLYKGLRELKRKGIVKKIGVSVYSIDEIEVITDKYDVDIIQCPLNLVDRSLVESGWHKRLKKMGVEVHVRSIFMQGLLLMKKDLIPNNFSKWKNIWNKWHSWIEEKNINTLDACIGFVSSIDEIDRIIVGVDSLKHLEEIVQSYKLNQVSEFPDISSNDIDLINPSLWKKS
jgi:aryl-alcohol dehydrogenase-like predicted oxidoreductase